MAQSIKKRRIVSLDLIRLAALITMLISHIIAYFYIGGNKLVLGLKDWANIVSFTTFLFVSAAVAYLVYLQNFRKKNFKFDSLLNRTIYLYAGYLILAFVVIIPGMLKSRVIDLKTFAEVVTWIKLPGYTEFMAPFIFFSLLLLLIPTLLKKISTQPWVLLVVGLGTFVIGEVLARQAGGLNLPYPIANWGHVLYGGDGIYRFPILQYTIVYLLGLHWGHIISDEEEDKQELKRETALMVASIVIVAGSLILGGKTELLRRWPPSIAFLAIGLAWVDILLLVAQKLNYTRESLKKIYNQLPLLQLPAQKTFSVLIIHTAMLTAGVYYFDLKTANIALIAAYYVITFLLCLFAIYWWQIVNELFGEVWNWKISSGRGMYIFISILAAIGIIAIAWVAIADPTVGDLKFKKDDKTKIKVNIEPEIKYWYDARLPYRYQLTIKNNDNNNWAEIEFDHQKLVKEKKSKTDGKDLIVVSWDRKNEKYKLVNFAVKNLNNAKTRLALDLKSIPDDDDLSTEIYFGDLFDDKTNFKSYPKTVTTDAEIAVSDDVAGSLNVKSSRLWHVTGDTVKMQFTLPEDVTDSDRLLYEVFKADTITNGKPAVLVTPVKKGLITWDPDRKYSISIPVKNLGYGKYYIRLNVALAARLEEENKTIETKYALGTKKIEGLIYSNYAPFIYSAPLYMTWTLDWEGYDLQQAYMDQIVAINTKYGMPVTHYFNPRIYVNKSISKDRANYLTNWVKARAAKGDEIGLHLHMHCDLVGATGLTPKTDPKWGGREECHDVLTTAYDYDEFWQIVKWSLDTFTEHGLPEPSGFRAGGWFLDLDNMKVLNDLGFVYDTSGSDYEAPYGPNKQSREWRGLSPTSRPYQPSQNNINTKTPPQMNIWEYPNNGADSTNRTAEELIRRFDLNIKQFNGSNILNQPQVLTYLTHPHWMGTIDNPKLIKLFDHAQPYKYADDNGPVIYKTQIDAHEAYKQIAK